MFVASFGCRLVLWGRLVMSEVRIRFWIVWLDRLGEMSLVVWECECEYLSFLFEYEFDAILMFRDQRDIQTDESPCLFNEPLQKQLINYTTPPYRSSLNMPFK